MRARVGMVITIKLKSTPWVLTSITASIHEEGIDPSTTDTTKGTTTITRATTLRGKATTTTGQEETTCETKYKILV